MIDRPQDIRPQDIRIDDLKHPVLTDIQKAAMEFAAATPVSLTEQAVLDAARERTGLSDFGPEDFRPRLALWLEAARADESLGPVGQLTIFGRCQRAAANRLWIEDYVKRHPDALEVEIKAPIIVAGLPRSGTTHLLNLMAADRRFRCLPYWESLQPVPDPRESRGEDGVDPRYARCAVEAEQADLALPLLKAMHHMSPDHVHEEIELQAPDFSSYLIEWIAHVPKWRDYYLAHDQRPHYAYMKKVLQILQHRQGPDRWVLKSPQHMEQLVPLYETFPDATIVMTHRDPVSVIQSTATMLAYGNRLRCAEVDVDAVAAYWTDRVERILKSCVADRNKIPESQSLDVMFHEFMADDMATVEQIYQLADQPFDAQARGDLQAYLDANPRGKHGQVIYDLRQDFGLEPAEVRARFQFYFDRFPVRAEGA